ncbi:MAG: FeoB-associated Cys-rich membrane protein [Ruminococcaceae bacterium]|nr:FeoB-associated Cys-rich membrane protein [Oscillospiraceae bacterium]
MQPVDIIAIAVILLVIGAATFYIIKAKKSGKRCIGCPDSSSCSGSCGSCGSCCNCEKKDS